MLPELEAALKLLSQYGFEKVLVMSFAIAAWPMSKLLLPIVKQSIKERETLMLEIAKNRENQQTTMNNHIAHLQEAFEKQMEKLADVHSESMKMVVETQREMTKANQEVARTLEASTQALGTLQDNIRGEFTVLRDWLRDRP